MYIVLLGAPGAGKGTQMAILSQELGVPSIAAGDLFREAVRQGTAIGLQAKPYMDRGELVPDDLAIRMVLERLEEPDCASGCVLDGFPRTLAQARALAGALVMQGEAVGRAIYIKVSEKELLRRLSGRWLCSVCQASYHEVDFPPKVTGRCDRCGGELYQRVDDSRETVLNRLGVYFIQTAPLLRHYAAAGLLVEVNGEQEIEKVGRDIINAVRDYAGKVRPGL